jgi:hypothetical protein
MPAALRGSGSALWCALASWARSLQFRDGAKARQQRSGVTVGDRCTFVRDSGGQGPLLIGIGENDHVRGTHVEPERGHRSSMRHEHFADRPPLEFGYRTCRDHRNPLTLETLHELLPSIIVVVHEDDRQPGIGEQVATSGTPPFEYEGAITNARHLQRGTLRTTVFHFTTSSVPHPLRRRGRNVRFSGGVPNSVPYPAAEKSPLGAVIHRSGVALVQQPTCLRVRLNGYGSDAAARNQRAAAPARLGNTFRPVASSSIILFSSNARASRWLGR